MFPKSGNCPRSYSNLNSYAVVFAVEMTVFGQFLQQVILQCCTLCCTKCCFKGKTTAIRTAVLYGLLYKQSKNESGCPISEAATR